MGLTTVQRDCAACDVSFTLTQWSAVYDDLSLTELTDRTDDLEIAYRCDQPAVYCSLKKLYDTSPKCSSVDRIE